jgi:putative addiction module killer protein
MAMVERFQVELYEDARGRRPFSTWLYGLRDRAAMDGIRARIARILAGNLGDHRDLGGGLLEMRIFQGPGYRLYFARTGWWLVLLLCGGAKSSQTRDIARARRYLRDYLERKHGSEQELD